MIPSRFSPPLRGAFALALLLFAGTAAALAPPKGATEVRSVEGITEYRLDNGLSVLLFAGRHQAHGDGQHHLPGRLAPRELRRNRHGAPARTFAVQGHAHDFRHPGRDEEARHRLQCQHLARPHQLLLQLQRRRRHAATGCWRWKPTACATRTFAAATSTAR
jgi:hypothetical protein